MMDHTSLVQNIENQKIYAMNMKELSEQNNGCKSLRTEIKKKYVCIHVYEHRSHYAYKRYTQKGIRV
jgi:hypothetical protein